MADETKPATLLPPKVAALRGPTAMERSVSQDMREEREDLKEAAEHSLNVIMDLDLESKIRYVTDSWKDVIGTPSKEVIGKSVFDILYEGTEGFAETIESVRKDDSRSHIVRFSVRMGPNSALRKRRSKPAADDVNDPQAPHSPTFTNDGEEQILNLEAQGIMIYDRTTGAESHVCLTWNLQSSMLTPTDYVDDPAPSHSRSDHRPPGVSRRITGCGSRSAGTLPYGIGRAGCKRSTKPSTAASRPLPSLRAPDYALVV